MLCCPLRQSTLPGPPTKLMMAVEEEVLISEQSHFITHTCIGHIQERIVKAVDVSKTLLHYGW